ncbi:MAG: DUF420 domain-containing protein [Verrucomicrobiales bacterium]|nr:DUF420 domain-containing protein [Verrucomicrobiales bacterium]
MSVSDMPGLNAALNGAATVLLTLGFIFIRRGQREAHKRCMLGALMVSSVFLVSYVTHKILVRGVHTKLGAEGVIKVLYYLMLFSHILLAAAIVPLALMTMTRALRERFDAHRRLARWTWPLWMYVSVTGVLIYFMLYHWFPAAAQ